MGFFKWWMVLELECADLLALLASRRVRGISKVNEEFSARSPLRGVARKSADASPFV
jgi:hypothetical protein